MDQCTVVIDRIDYKIPSVIPSGLIFFFAIMGPYIKDVHYFFPIFDPPSPYIHYRPT